MTTLSFMTLIPRIGPDHLLSLLIYNEQCIVKKKIRNVLNLDCLKSFLDQMQPKQRLLIVSILRADDQAHMWDDYENVFCLFYRDSYVILT